MTEYYAEKLSQGLQFQDFVTDRLIESLGIALSTYQSKKWQVIGENKQGIEIKFDDRMNDTGNIYIETAEKSNPANLEYIDSGIFRDDNSWLYIIGNYSILYIFGKITLKNMYQSGKYIRKEIPTSRGFLVAINEAKKYALKIIQCEKVKS